MTVHKLSVSLTSELDMALTHMCLRRGMSKSRLLELLLREHPDMAPYIKRIQEEPDATVAAAPGKLARQRAGKRATRASSASG